MYSVKLKCQHISLFFPSYSYPKVSEKLKTSSLLELAFELKIQKQHSHLKFMSAILIHIDSAFKYTP